MSVKIEILDYNGVISISGGGPSSGFDLFLGTTQHPGDFTVTNATTLQYTETSGIASNRFYLDTSSLVDGQTYTLNYEITSFNGTGVVPQVWVLTQSTGSPAAVYYGTTSMESVTWTFVAGEDLFFSILWCDNVTISNISISSAVVTNGVSVDWSNSVVGELDVTDHSDFPLAMTFQISDIKDITSTSGDYSKTFKIPATKNNNKLLKNAYIPNIDTLVNITENKKCRILINNLFSITGLIKVTGVGGYGETPSYYDCVFFGSNLSWADDLSDKYINELDWGVSGNNLEYNKTKIMDTWQDEDCDSSTSPIVYPITSYGDYNPDGEPRTIQLLDTITDALGYLPTKVGYNGFHDWGHSYGAPLPSADWRPAVFVKDTLEKIFNKVGYQINSTFMETDMFKKLVWLLPNFKYNNAEEQYSEYSVESNFTNGVSMSETAVPSENGIQKFQESSLAEDDVDYYYTGDGRELLEIDTATNLNVTLDEGSYVDSTTHYITIGEYGYYNIKLNGIQSRVATAYQNSVSGLKIIDRIDSKINLEYQTVGQSAWHIINDSFLHTVISTGVNSSTSASTSYEDMSSVDAQGVWLNKGDKIRLTLGIKIFADDDSHDFYVSVFFKSGSSSTFDISLNSEAVAYGQTYDLKDVINKDYKQIDFVKGITHAFNLKMTTDETTKTVSIEPFNTFYKDYADAIDWTYKLDRSKQIEDKWIKSDLKRDLVFKYKSDSKDKKVERRGDTFFNGIKDEYPYQETLPKTFEKGESKYENPFFAGTYNAKDQDTVQFSPADNPFSACLWQEITDPTYSYRPDKGYEFLPRLLYWNKYSPTGLPNPAGNFGMHKYAAVQTWASEVKYLNPNADFAIYGNIISNIYPQATSINRDDSSSPILSYGNVYVRYYDDVTNIYSSYESGKGLFETYYKNMFEMFKAKPRLRTAYIDLKTTDIVSLDFRKLVYIDGVYWRLNKVVDYQPNKNQPTKVELIQWMSLGAFAALPPSFNGNENIGGFDDPAIDDSNDNVGL